MIELQPPFRPATPDDAAAMADFVHFASEGLALYLWTRMAGAGGDPWAVGRERAGRETGAFSYRNAVVMERDGGPPPASSAIRSPTRQSPSRPTCRRCSCRCRSWRTWRRAHGT